VILIDSNIPMYLIRAPHPLKEVAGPMLERVLRERERLVTNAEVLQEILHRYSSIRRPEAIPVAFELVLDIVDTVFPIEQEDVEEARRILLA
jgi:predicted nucleic acid-binding protein